MREDTTGSRTTTGKPVSGGRKAACTRQQPTCLAEWFRAGAGQILWGCSAPSLQACHTWLLIEQARKTSKALRNLTFSVPQAGAWWEEVEPWGTKGPSPRKKQDLGRERGLMVAGGGPRGWMGPTAEDGAWGEGRTPKEEKRYGGGCIVHYLYKWSHVEKLALEVGLTPPI